MNRSLRYTILAAFMSLLFTPICHAEDIPPPGDDKFVEDATDKPASSVPSDDNKEVTIIKKKEAIIEEVRVNGKLRYAKITPTKGKPYYMYDSNGDGVLDATETDIKKANVNQWILMEW